MKLIRTILLLPIILIIGIVVRVRNLLYDFNFIKSYSFEDHVKTISIGNLSVGGTGKTPHIEYVIRLLLPFFNDEASGQIATLSRGYKRKSKGFVLGGRVSTAQDLGDEPAQFLKKFESVQVAVDEKRPRGVRKLLNLFSNLKVVLLDDAYQHRRIKAGLSILLTSYSKPYFDDHLFPVGRLREQAIGSARADIIIISKSPKFISPMEKRIMKEKLNLRPYQTLYFSYIDYGTPQAVFTQQDALKEQIKIEGEELSVLMITGIAEPYHLKEYLKEHCREVKHLRFRDHHNFTKSDVEKIELEYEQIYRNKKIILTTEKDAMRLKDTNLQSSLLHLPVYFIPIYVRFNEKDTEALNTQILNYVREDKIDSEVYKRSN